jgi:hypothetical protein
MAQRGNISAKLELMKFVDYTIDDWIERYCLLSRWWEHKAEIRTNVVRCIRRYRYSGSFLRYVFRTLEYAAKGLKPLQVHLDDSLIFEN